MSLFLFICLHAAKNWTEFLGTGGTTLGKEHVRSGNFEV